MVEGQANCTHFIKQKIEGVRGSSFWQKLAHKKVNKISKLNKNALLFCTNSTQCAIADKQHEQGSTFWIYCRGSDKLYRFCRAAQCANKFIVEWSGNYSLNVVNDDELANEFNRLFNGIFYFNKPYSEDVGTIRWYWRKNNLYFTKYESSAILSNTISGIFEPVIEHKLLLLKEATNSDQEEKHIDGKIKKLQNKLKNNAGIKGIIEALQTKMVCKNSIVNEAYGFFCVFNDGMSYIYIYIYPYTILIYIYISHI